ncbi:transcriptional regulator, GntR family [Novosphingobium sp. CF614]|uniref:histidine utilization repressor n=1 Tax=Novosphingobium sp. CF614 TaxID=1884364 RepID=UPI0008E2A11E|nr:histidine utilization repressor [Novosphingobium sp. CF614]SFF98601.1 transcriptional regulator, GntR family [Novosphingobium sp. CF614]
MASTALHERIRTDIESRILSGVLKPGDKIPSELELMGLYGCSRMTVNKALSALNSAGLLERRKRAGSCVARPRTVAMMLDVPDLPAEVAKRGQAYRFDLLKREISDTRHHRSIAEKIGCEGRVLVTHGVHRADAVPIAYEERLVSLSAVPDIETQDFADEPPGSWLLRHIPWTEAENRIGAAGAGSEAARALNVNVGAPCLSVERRTWQAAQCITFVRQLYVAGSYELIARFGPAQKGPVQNGPV